MYAVICRTSSTDIPGNRSLLPQPLNESFLIQLLKKTVVDELLGGQFRDPRIAFRHLLHHGLECLRRRARDPRNVLQNIQIVEVIKDRRIAATEILLHHLNTERALGLGMVHAFNKTTDKLAYGIFLTFDKRTGGDDRRGREISPILAISGSSLKPSLRATIASSALTTAASSAPALSAFKRSGIPPSCSTAKPRCRLTGH